MNDYHKPVLLREVLGGLKVRQSGKYIDATLGGGGHSFEILKLGGVVLGIDVDRDAIEHIEKNNKPDNLILARGNFRDIDKIAQEWNFCKVAGIIFDLGVSSHQIDEPERGFSFQGEGPLDMRMDQELGVRALDLIKILTKGELNEIFTKFGEETRAWAISDAIVRARRIKPIETTGDLARVVDEGLRRKGLGFGDNRAGKSMKVFQALRIAVNDELNAISEALPKALGLLEENGRLCVISFHSLEDRIVKRKFLEFEGKGEGIIITEKPIIPSGEETEGNARSRSAKLRIFEKKL
jgi:16S rRNA (cytosine1402-N4)-methyltransferase